MFVEGRFERMVNRLCGKAAVPLRLQLWNGRNVDLCPQPTVTVAIPDPSALKYFVSPDLSKLGEAFVEGRIHVEGSIHEIFRVAEGLAREAGAAARRGAHRSARHDRDHDRKAIAYHYDVSDEFYSLFLGREMVYSCAYYRDEADSLDAAQSQKLDHILRKLALRPGHRLLDIGCGWGALILKAARDYGAIATGVTLSKNQYDHARERIRAEGLEGRCTVALRDYRDLPRGGGFDRIASVGMFEHVGLKHLRGYFDTIRSLLNDGGLVLNHGITTSDPDSGWMQLGAGEFIDRYVFPDGELPHLSLVIRSLSEAGLESLDVESLRRHYARTCREWADRLDANRERALACAGEKRLRIWQIYLAGCAYGFANGWMNVYQVLASKSGDPQAAALPLTRDYMYRA